MSPFQTVCNPHLPPDIIFQLKATENVFITEKACMLVLHRVVKDEIAISRRELIRVASASSSKCKLD